ncbi:MAG: aldehyde dehydrogenase family protein [Stellaceae bacterium]
MVITKEAIFGPVAPLYRFKSEGEAIKMANDTPHPNPPPPAGEGGEGAASGASLRGSTTASSASTRASSRFGALLPADPPSGCFPLHRCPWADRWSITTSARTLAGRCRRTRPSVFRTAPGR